jgi:hypothetical protein
MSGDEEQANERIASLYKRIHKLEADKPDAERYRWLKDCTNEQFDYISDNWCQLDAAIDSMRAVERSGEYASPSRMKCEHVFNEDRCVKCGGVA